MIYCKLADKLISFSDDFLNRSPLIRKKFASFEEHINIGTDISFTSYQQNQNWKEIKTQLIYENSECNFATKVYLLRNKDYVFSFNENKEKPLLVFHVSHDWKKFTLLKDNTNDDGYILFNRTGALINLSFLIFHACVFHGVVMEYDGLGILVMAPSGVGKTTHTNMWEQYEDALIINGDRCLCRYIDGTWYAYGMPWAGSSGKILNRRVKINAIVDLNRGNINKAEIVSKFDAEVYLLQRIFAPVTYGHLQDLAFSHVHEIASEIPVIHFECRPDRESVQVLKEKILEIASGR